MDSDDSAWLTYFAEFRESPWKPIDLICDLKPSMGAVVGPVMQQNDFVVVSGCHVIVIIVLLVVSARRTHDPCQRTLIAAQSRGSIRIPRCRHTHIIRIGLFLKNIPKRPSLTKMHMWNESAKYSN